MRDCVVLCDVGDNSTIIYHRILQQILKYKCKLHVIPTLLDDLSQISSSERMASMAAVRLSPVTDINKKNTLVQDNNQQTTT